MTDQQLINRGSDAEQFKRYLEDNPYFNSVVEEARRIITESIMSLKPDEQMKFTVLKSMLTSIDDLLNLIEIDVYAGQKALAKLQAGGDEGITQKGIL
jgi:hypothetical protein